MTAAGSGTVGPYALLEEIGRGSTATVYRVRPTGGGAEVALKVLRPDLALVESAVTMFADEARIAARITHPNVVRVLGTGEHQGTPYIVQELVEGLSLGELQTRAQERARRIELGTLLAVLAQAAEGLHAAHETRDALGAPSNIVHRDVKPHNVLSGLDGRVRVVDFGVAAARDRSTRTATGATKGTLAYLAPEQILSPREVDRRADIWALGVMAFEAITGQRLFFDKMEGVTIWNVVHREIPALPADGSVPAAVTQVVSRCLSRNRDQRPASAAAVAEVLESEAAALGSGGLEPIARLTRELA